MKSLLLVLASIALSAYAQLTPCSREDDPCDSGFGVTVCCGPAGTAFLSCKNGKITLNDCEDSEESCYDTDNGAVCM